MDVDDSFPRSTRREFLAGAAVAAGAIVAGASPADASPRPASSARDLVPGQTVRVSWPWGLGSAGVEVVHRHGTRETRTPAPVPSGILLRRIEVVAMPFAGRMRAGRHDFFLEVPGRGRLWLGGFGVSLFRFGC